MFIRHKNYLKNKVTQRLLMKINVDITDYLKLLRIFGSMDIFTVK